MPKGKSKRAAVAAEPTEDEQMTDAPAPAQAAERTAEQTSETAAMADAPVVDLEAEDDAAADTEGEEPMRVRLVSDSYRGA